jgi:hypothetical protein
MTRRYIHYEAAFEDYLRSRGLPYIAVDEHRKAIFAGSRVKSFDFLVYRADEPTWLVDVKGRKFPYELDGRRRYWENWVTRDDLEGLRCWQEAFGAGFEGVFVFAYLLTGLDDPAAVDLERAMARAAELGYVHPFRGDHYAFMCIGLDDYEHTCRQRSPKWDTLTVPTRRFRELARPIQLPTHRNA